MWRWLTDAVTLLMWRRVGRLPSTLIGWVSASPAEDRHWCCTPNLFCSNFIVKCAFHQSLQWKILSLYLTVSAGNTECQLSEQARVTQTRYTDNSQKCAHRGNLRVQHAQDQSHRCSVLVTTLFPKNWRFLYVCGFFSHAGWKRASTQTSTQSSFYKKCGFPSRSRRTLKNGHKMWVVIEDLIRNDLIIDYSLTITSPIIPCEGEYLFLLALFL